MSDDFFSPTEGAAARGPQVAIYTDGGCAPNPGPGGWGAIIVFQEIEMELIGGQDSSTNNQMELTAAISALEALRQPCLVDIFTDSQYVRNGITLWIRQWKDNGWRTADKKEVKNIELWKRLEEAVVRHHVRWHWVRGHSGHPENERADELVHEGRSTVISRALIRASATRVRKRRAR